MSTRTETGDRVEEPFTLFAELTHRHTEESAVRGRELSTNQWEEVLRLVAGLGVEEATFTGGEPSVRADLVDLVRLASTYLGLHTRLITSGTMLPGWRLQALEKAGLDCIELCTVAGAGSRERMKNVSYRDRSTLAWAHQVVECGISLEHNVLLPLAFLDDVVDTALATGATALTLNFTERLGREARAQVARRSQWVENRLDLRINEGLNRRFLLVNPRGEVFSGTPPSYVGCGMASSGVAIS